MDNKPKSPNPYVEHATQQFQCIRHELSNDSTIVNLKRTLVRAPQLLKQKVNIGSQMPKDEEFESLYTRFINISDQLQILESEIGKYHLQTQSFIEHSVLLTRAFGNVFNPSLEDIRHLDNSTRDMSLLKFSQSVTFENRLTDVKLKLIPTLVVLLDNVKAPVTKLLGLVKNIKLGIKERDYSVLDINKYRNLIENLSKKVQGSYTLSQQQNLVRYERSLEIAKLKYSHINNSFKTELPKFNKLVGELICSLTVIFYYIQLSISFDSMGKSESIDPLFQLADQTKDTEKPTIEYFDALVSDFIKKQRTTKGNLDNLSIIKTKLELEYKILLPSDYSA